MLPWLSIAPFGAAVVPEVKTISKSVSRVGRGTVSSCASQSSGKGGSPSVPASATSAGTVRMTTSGSSTSRTSGASRPVPMAIHVVSARAAMRSITSADMRRSSGTMATPSRAAPKVSAASSGPEGHQVRRRSPGRMPSAYRRQAASRERRSTSGALQACCRPSSAARAMATSVGRRCAASSRISRSEG